MASNQSSTLESLRKSKNKLDEEQSPRDTEPQKTPADATSRRKKTYSLTNQAILAIERIRFEAAKSGENLSASDIVDEAILLLLKQKGLRV